MLKHQQARRSSILLPRWT